jgi:hypothetical protein
MNPAHTIISWFKIHSSITTPSTARLGTRDSVVCRGTMLQAGRWMIRFPMRSLNFFFNWPNPSSRTMWVRLILLTEMSTRKISDGKGRPTDALGWQPHRYLWADCLEKMWEPQRLTSQWALTACYRDSFTSFTPRFSEWSVPSQIS